MIRRLFLVAVVIAGLAVPASGGTLVPCARKNLLTGMIANGATIKLRTTCRLSEIQVKDSSMIGLPADISAHVHRSSNQAVADNDPNVFVQFDSVPRWDTNSFFDSGQPTRLTVHTPGKYLIYATVEFVLNSTGLRQVSLQVNRSITIAAANGSPTPSAQGNFLTVVTRRDLKQDDYVEVNVYQNSGAPLDLRANPAVSPEFGMVKLP